MVNLNSLAQVYLQRTIKISCYLISSLKSQEDYKFKVDQNFFRMFWNLDIFLAEYFRINEVWIYSISFLFIFFVYIEFNHQLLSLACRSYPENYLLIYLLIILLDFSWWRGPLTLHESINLLDPWFQFTVSTAQVPVSVAHSSIFEAFFVYIKQRNVSFLLSKAVGSFLSGVSFELLFFFFCILFFSQNLIFELRPFILQF